jgi:hypothetical protein
LTTNRAQAVDTEMYTVMRLLSSPGESEEVDTGFADAFATGATLRPAGGVPPETTAALAALYRANTPAETRDRSH